MKKSVALRVTLFCMLIMLLNSLHAQNTKDNNDNPAFDLDRLLDVTSASQSIKLHRMTTMDRNAIESARLTEGLLILNIDENANYFLFEGKWIRMMEVSPDGALLKPLDSDFVTNNNAVINSAIEDESPCCDSLSIKCPSNLVAYMDKDSCKKQVTWNINLSIYPIECGPVNVISSNFSGQYFSVGTHVINCLAYDPCSNFRSCSFVLTVIDTFLSPPVFNHCPSNIVTTTNSE